MKLILDNKVGTYQSLAKIHHVLFEDIYPFAGKTREVNIAKDNFRFALVADFSLLTFMKGLDASYYYEGYYEYKTEDL